MPFYTKINNLFKVSNIFVKPSGSEILKEAKNVWVKNTNNVLKPIWSYSWVPGSWSACSVNCGGGIQTRDISCTRNDGIIKSEKFCSDITKPITQQSCNTQACGVDVKACSAGYGNIPLDDGYCNTRVTVNVYTIWDGAGTYYANVDIMPTAQYVPEASTSDASFLSNVKLTFDYGFNLTFQVKSYNNLSRNAVCTVTTGYGGSFELPNLRSDLLDGDGEGYYTHWYKNVRLCCSGTVQLSSPTITSISCNVVGSTVQGKSSINDARMCIAQVVLSKNVLIIT